MEKLLFESDGKNISENKKKIGRKLGVIFLIAGGIGFLLFGNMYSNFYGENRVLKIYIESGCNVHNKCRFNKAKDRVV